MAARKKTKDTGLEARIGKPAGGAGKAAKPAKTATSANKPATRSTKTSQASKGLGARLSMNGKTAAVTKSKGKTAKATNAKTTAKLVNGKPANAKSTAKSAKNITTLNAAGLIKDIKLTQFDKLFKQQQAEKDRARKLESDPLYLAIHNPKRRLQIKRNEKAKPEAKSKNSSNSQTSSTSSVWKRGTGVVKAPQLQIKDASIPPLVRVSNLDFGTSAADVVTVLEAAGPVEECRTRARNRTVMAEVQFASRDGAERAVAQFHGAVADNRTISLEVIRQFSISQSVPSATNGKVSAASTAWSR